MSGRSRFWGLPGEAGDDRTSGRDRRPWPFRFGATGLEPAGNSLATCPLARGYVLQISPRCWMGAYPGQRRDAAACGYTQGGAASEAGGPAGTRGDAGRPGPFGAAEGGGIVSFTWEASRMAVLISARVCLLASSMSSGKRRSEILALVTWPVPQPVPPPGELLSMIWAGGRCERASLVIQCPPPGVAGSSGSGQRMWANREDS